MRARVYLLIALISTPFLGSAQNWVHYRNEVWLGTGATTFLGEVGGANRAGRDLFWDFDGSMTRYVFGGGYRWRAHDLVSLKTSIYWGSLRGDDQRTKEIFRQNRNLHFRSPIGELSVQGEFYFVREKLGHIYRMNKSVKGKNHLNLAAYGFVGIGGIYYQPKAKYNGRWHKLKPLGTEGQGLPGGASTYSNWTLSVPYGIGVKHILNKHWSIGLEGGFRKTFSDYLDDASGIYYDGAAINASNTAAGRDGDMAEYLANPTTGALDDYPPYNDPTFRFQTPTDPGQQRGDITDNDSYNFLVFSVNYRFLRYRRNLPKF